MVRERAIEKIRNTEAGGGLKTIGSVFLIVMSVE